MTTVLSRGGRLLIVDDDQSCAAALGRLARADGYEVALADCGEAAMAAVERFRPDAVITDLQMPDFNGNELVRRLRERDAALPVVVVTGYSKVDTAVEAMQAGAADYVPKPIDWSALATTVAYELQRRALRADRVACDTQLIERLGLGLGTLVGNSAPMRAAYDQARRAADARATVLITGESGTGKGELARAIHALSGRAGPFESLHCAALAGTLVETELFGHERGAFTGAHERHVGRFERARGGTVFIDEVAEIPPSTQIKLLRVLQEKAFERVGGNETIEVDLRLIVATNADLARNVRQGRFREDLYYRLNVVAIEMPPLRERGDDVMLLAQYFLDRSAKTNGKAVGAISDGARDALLAHSWPGNVRELENAIERAVVMCSGSELRARDLPDSSAPSQRVRIPGASLEEIELDAVRATFMASGGSTRRTAEVLGLSPRTVQYRLRELGLAKGRGRPRKDEPR